MNELKDIVVVTLVYDVVPLKFFEKALDSIDNQTIREKFNLVIVLNGNCEKFYDTIAKYDDERYYTFIIANDENQSIPRSFNQVLAKTNAKYFTIQDADDFSNIDRIAYQYEFMEENPNCGVVGCHTVWIDENNKQIGVWDFPVNPNEYWGIKNHNMIVAPFMRRVVVDYCGGFDENFPYCWDYKLYIDMWRNGWVTANIPMFLYFYRKWSGQVSVKYRKEQIIEDRMITNMAKAYRRCL